ncbi:MAG: T9SS type A sorting domain-containing protein [Ignavibacteriae bacterium]|nr:T9SS type A sorting domain-containing protein [Ignavibacteriota bacterium]
MKIVLSVVAFVLVLLVTGTSFGQAPIFTRSDFEANFKNVQRWQYGIEYDPYPTVDLGTASLLKQAFDFSNIAGTVVSEDSILENYVPPTGLPGAAQFPTATTASCITLPPPFPGVTASFYSYYSIENDGLYLLGYATYYSIPGFGDSTIIQRFSPKALLAPLPLTVGTSRTSQDTLYIDPDTYEFTMRGYTADGWGNLTLPNGVSLASVASSPAIRMLVDEISEEYSGGFVTKRHHDRAVVFIAQDGSFAIFGDLDSVYTGGSTPIDGIEYNVKQGPTGVTQLPSGIPDRFGLLQNYPNPFNPVTTIAFEIPQLAHVVLKVYNVLGSEVSTLVNEELQPGIYAVKFDASRTPYIGGMASGVYYYRLTAGSYTKTMKLTLMK